MGVRYLPPRQYDHEPKQEYKIEYGWWPRPWAYVGDVPGIDVIHLPNRWVKPIFYANQSYEDIIRHEKGHLNGWPQDHPGMVVEKT